MKLVLLRVAKKAVKRAVERAVRKAESWAHQMAPQRVAKRDALKVENSMQWPRELVIISSRGWRRKAEDEIKSTGHVIDTLEAALWAVGTTDSFKAAILKAVNLGGDSDTIGAVAGQLAGARYGLACIPVDWRQKLVKFEKILEISNQQIRATISTTNAYPNQVSIIQLFYIIFKFKIQIIHTSFKLKCKISNSSNFRFHSHRVRRGSRRLAQTTPELEQT